MSLEEDSKESSKNLDEQNDAHNINEYETPKSRYFEK